MKKILFTIISGALISFSSIAQTDSESIDLVQAAIGIEKKEAFNSFIILNETNRNAFWKLYDEYEVKRKVLGKERIALLEKYVNDYNNMNEENTSLALKKMINMSSEFNELVATYTKKIERSAGAKPAAQFFQLESYITSVVRASILENIPLIGEFENE
jgi:hypothetical protein